MTIWSAVSTLWLFGSWRIRHQRYRFVAYLNSLIFVGPKCDYLGLFDCSGCDYLETIQHFYRIELKNLLRLGQQTILSLRIFLPRWNKKNFRWKLDSRREMMFFNIRFFENTFIHPKLKFWNCLFISFFLNYSSLGIAYLTENCIWITFEFRARLVFWHNNSQKYFLLTTVGWKRYLFKNRNEKFNE